MLNPQVLVRICSENGVDPDAVRLNAESIALPQGHKCWGLTDAQSDVIAAMHSLGTIQAAVNLAVDHYLKVNGGSILCGNYYPQLDKSTGTSI